MSRKTNPEEKILDYFESASPDAAQATLNMIKAILKRKQVHAISDSYPANRRAVRHTTNSKRKDQAFNSAPPKMREVPEADHGTPRQLPPLS